MPPPDPNPLLNNLLLSLGAIDQRLGRIETALRIPPLPPLEPVAWSVAGPAPLSGPAAVRPAGPAAVAAAPPPQPPPPRPLYPTVKPLEPPPEGFPVSSRTAMQDELDAWTVLRGYSMRINGTRTHGARQKIRLVCFRGGRNRPSRREPVAPEVVAAAKAAGRRKPTTDRASKKCDCPFKFELVELGPGLDRYVVHYTNRDNMAHNHAPGDLRLDPRARKLPPAVNVEVDAWLREGLAVGKIQEQLRRRGYEHVLDFDLRNRKRALLKKDGLLGGGGGEGETTNLSFAPQFVEDMDADGVADDLN